MAIEDWDDAVVEPRIHTLVGFHPGRGFAPPSVETVSALDAIEFENDEDSGSDPAPFDALASEIWKD